MDIAQILSRVELPTTSVTLCLRGDLVAEYEQLDAQLRDAAPSISLAGPASDTAARMDALRQEMLAHEAPFTFRALPAKRFAPLRRALPVRGKDETDEQAAAAYHRWVCKLISASMAEPTVTEDEADQLADVLSDAQWSKLSNAAWSVNTEAASVPFSAAASALSRISDSKSKPPAASESPEADSSAGSLSGAPDTSTTPPVD